MNNVGPISQCVIEPLATWGISLPDPIPFPQSLTDSDLLSAALVVALKEVEHRPLLAERFPGWEDRVEYWHVHDVDEATPTEALAEITQHVEALISRLKAAGR